MDIAGNTVEVESTLQTDLATTLDHLLKDYLDLLSKERGSQWSKHEGDLVRDVRDVLTRAGHPPVLGHDTLAHLDYPMFSAG